MQTSCKIIARQEWFEFDTICQNLIEMKINFDNITKKCNNLFFF